MYACTAPFHYWFLFPIGWGLIIIVAALLLWRRGRCWPRGSWQTGAPDSARAVAERRYAAGEISREELQAILRTLQP